MKNSRQSQLAQIHIAKKQLGLDDGTYRSMLYTLCRVESAANLDYAGRNKVLEHLKARGFKNKQTPVVAKEKQALMAKVNALLAAMELDLSYADGIARRMFKREKVQWCKPEELRGIVTALVKKQQKAA